MGILTKFLAYFGGAFLGIGVIILSFMRRRMVNHTKRIKKKRRMQRRANQANFPWNGHR